MPAYEIPPALPGDVYCLYQNILDSNEKSEPVSDISLRKYVKFIKYNIENIT